MDLIERTVPVVALRGSVVFPKVEAILTFGRPKSKTAVNDSFNGDRLLAIFTQKDARVADPYQEDMYQVGTLATIQQLMPTENEYHVLVRGVSRIKLSEILSQEPFLVCKVSEVSEVAGNTEAEEALSKHLTQLFEKAVRLGKPVDVQTVMRLLSAKIEPSELADQIAYLLDIKASQKQELLQETSLEVRLKRVTDVLTHEVGVLELEKTISTKTQKRFEEQMRKAMLRERQKTIAQELKGLGEEEPDDEVAELRKKIKLAKMPKEVNEKAEKELERLFQMPPHNPENAYIRNYLDWLVEMPWSKTSTSAISIKSAAKILDQDHYALKKVKERILEYLAVMELKSKSKSKSKMEDGEEGVVSGKGNDHPTIL